MNKTRCLKEHLVCIGWKDVLPCLFQVLIRIHACGVNPVETYIRAGWYPRKPTLPYTPGTDAAGVVESIGEGVTAVKVWWTNNCYIFFCLLFPVYLFFSLLNEATAECGFWEFISDENKGHHRNLNIPTVLKFVPVKF